MHLFLGSNRFQIPGASFAHCPVSVSSRLPGQQFKDARNRALTTRSHTSLWMWMQVKSLRASFDIEITF